MLLSLHPAKGHIHTIKLTFNGQTGQSSSIKCTSFLSDRGNIVPEWAFKLNIVLVAEETWHLKDYTLKVSILEHEN